jgi:thiosulfate/3-mercaptopyruvate sulfurtransferase
MIKRWKFPLLKLKKNKLFTLSAAICACLVMLPMLHAPAFSGAPNAKIQFVSPNWVVENAKDPNLRILDVRNIPLDYIALLCHFRRRKNRNQGEPGRSKLEKLVYKQ